MQEFAIFNYDKLLKAANFVYSETLVTLEIIFVYLYYTIYYFYEKDLIKRRKVKLETT